MAIIQIDDEFLKDVIIEIGEEIGLGEKIPSLIAEAAIQKIRMIEDEQDNRSGSFYN